MTLGVSASIPPQSAQSPISQSQTGAHSLDLSPEDQDAIKRAQGMLSDAQMRAQNAKAIAEIVAGATIQTH